MVWRLGRSRTVSSAAPAFNRTLTNRYCGSALQTHEPAEFPQPSVTAVGATLMRAVHTELDHPRLIQDPWGYRLLTNEDLDAFLAASLRFIPPRLREQLRHIPAREAVPIVARRLPAYGMVIVRTHYTEEALERAAAAGVHQYVVIGAGFDSFALRRPRFAEDIEIYEIDHPVTQALKRQRISDAGLSPTGVHYIAADLTTEHVDVALARSSFDFARRAFCSCLGLMPYLSQDRSLAILASIARCFAPASQVVFTYLDAAAFERGDRERWRSRQTALTAIGEPWRSGFSPGKLEDELRGIGLQLLENMLSADLRARYCTDRHDAISRSIGANLARACVP